MTERKRDGEKVGKSMINQFEMNNVSLSPKKKNFFFSGHFLFHFHYGRERTGPIMITITKVSNYHLAESTFRQYDGNVKLDSKGRVSCGW